jgi:hypothetical protein
MVTQAWTSEAREISLVKHMRSAVAPRKLDWVDPHVHGRVGDLNLAEPQTLIASFSAYTDFYNKSVDRLYSLIDFYDHCGISIAPDGVLTQAGGPTCAPWPRYLVVERTHIFPTLAGQAVVAAMPLQGTLVRIPAGPPRLVGVVQPPCQEDECLGVLGITVFGQRLPGTVAITFGAAPQPHLVALVGGRRWLLPADQETTVRVPVGGGPGFSKLVMPVSWSSPQGAPALLSVVLESAGTTTRLY